MHWLIVDITHFVVRSKHLRNWHSQYRNITVPGRDESRCSKMYILKGKMSILTGEMSIFTGKCLFYGEMSILRENVYFYGKNVPEPIKTRYWNRY